MVGSGQPSTNSFDTESKSTVGNTSIFSHINVKFVRVPRCPFLFDSLDNLALGPCPFSSADNLAITFGGEQVMAEDILRVIRIWPVIEWLGYSRICLLYTSPSPRD